MGVLSNSKYEVEVMQGLSSPFSLMFVLCPSALSVSGESAGESDRVASHLVRNEIL